MRKRSFLLPVLLSNLLAACAADKPPGPTTITITTGQTPALVAVRDGIDADWQPATMKTSTRFEAEVNGPYTVTIVCEAPINHGAWIWQVARTPDDAHDITLDCVPLPVGHAITGHMVQAGHVRLGGSADTGASPGWDFALVAPNGSYDLIAVTDDRIAIRRRMTVDGDLVVMPEVDVAQEGVPFVDVGFSVTNALSGETLQAVVFVETPTTSLPARVYAGPIATAKVAPTSALAATDLQTASMRALDGPALRALRRPFRTGGNPAYTLPPALGGVQWTVEAGELSTSWTKLPELDTLTGHVSGFGADDQRGSNHDVAISARFLAATGVTRLTFDTDIPGYQAGWKINLSNRYQRHLQAQRIAGGEISTSSVTEVGNTPSAGTITSRTARPDQLTSSRR